MKFTVSRMYYSYATAGTTGMRVFATTVLLLLCQASPFIDNTVPPSMQLTEAILNACWLVTLGDTGTSRPYIYEQMYVTLISSLSQ